MIFRVLRTESIRRLMSRWVATLNQPAYAPWPVEEQVAVIYAANTGVLDRIEVAQVPEVNEQIRRELREGASDVLASIRDTKDLSDEAAAKIEEIAKKVAEQFAPSEGPSDQPSAEVVEAEEGAEEPVEETAGATAS